MATNTIASVTGSNGNFASGRAQQKHIVYAPNSGVWWAFWVDPNATTTLKCAYSSDLATWTGSTDKTLPLALIGGNQATATNTADGRNFGVWCQAIGSTDVIHVAAGLYTNAGSLSVYDIRATVTASSITWGSATQAITSTSTWSPDGTAPALADDGSYLINSCIPRYTGHNNGNETGVYNATADTSSSWTPGTWSQYQIEFVSSVISSHASHQIGSGKLLWLWDDGNGASNGQATNIRWAKADKSGSTPSPASVFASTTTIDANDWGSTRVSNSDIHCVRRTGTNTYEHRRFNGTSWSNGQSIPTQTSLATGGLAMTSDGTNVWLAIIDSAAGRAVRYIKWDGGSATWGTWTDLDNTSNSTRANLAAVQEASAPSKIAFLWTENPSGTTYNLRVAAISLATTSSVSGAASIALKAADLTKSAAASIALKAQDNTKSAAASIALKAIDQTKSAGASLALKKADIAASAAASVALLAVNTKSAGASVALKALDVQASAGASLALKAADLSKSAGASVALSATLSRSAAASVALLATDQTKSAAASLALLATNLSRSASSSVALKQADIAASAAARVALLATLSRSADAAMALKALDVPQSAAASVALLAADISRQAAASVALSATLSRSAGASFALLATNVSQSAAASLALQATDISRSAGASVALLAANLSKSAGASLALLATDQAANAAASLALKQTDITRSAGATVALQAAGLTKSAGASMALLATDQTKSAAASLALKQANIQASAGAAVALKQAGLQANASATVALLATDQTKSAAASFARWQRASRSLPAPPLP
jgi:hypothetical protein